MSARRKRTKKSPRRGGRVAAGLLVFGLVLLVALLGSGVWLDRVIRTQFEGKRWALPARIYARPLELHPDLRLSPAELVQELERLGYQKVNHSGSKFYTGLRLMEHLVPRDTYSPI